MQKNMGARDRAIRIILALNIGILLLTETAGGVPGLVLGVFAFVFLITSLLSRCPLYLPFHISTCRTVGK